MNRTEIKLLITSMAALLLIAVLIILVFAKTADAQGATCTGRGMPYEPWHGRMLANNPTAQVTELDADASKILLNGFNAIPPASTYTAERVFIMSKPGAPAVLVIFVTGRCLTLVNPLPRIKLKSWGVRMERLGR